MAAKFVLLLALLNLVVADPAPEPDPLHLIVNQEVNLGCCDKDKSDKIKVKPTEGVLGCDQANIQANIDRPKTGKLEPGNGTTLAFVFDSTGSMGYDLAQVKNGAMKILQASLSSTVSNIKNFVLVQYNDPAVGPLTVTTDPDEFQSAINAIWVNGGGDCPEMALGGIIMALEAMLPNSVMYVFTDASAADKYKLDTALDLIQEKKAKVDILMTGPNCYEYEDTTYETIASTSAGQVFTIEKGDVTMLLDYITVVASSAEAVTLNSFEFDMGGETDFDLNMDATIKEFTVSVSGTNPSIKIIGPGGEDLEENGTLEVHVDLANVKIVSVKDPSSGIYSANVGSGSSYTVRTTADTNINFEYGFSLTPTADFDETSLRPKGGEKSYIIVKPTDLDDFGDFYRIQLILKNETIVHDSSLKLKDGYDSCYDGTSFIPSEEPFQIKIFGCDQTGTEFVRLSSSYISAVYPVTMSRKKSFKKESRPDKVYYPPGQEI